MQAGMGGKGVGEILLYSSGTSSIAESLKVMHTVEPILYILQYNLFGL